MPRGGTKPKARGNSTEGTLTPIFRKMPGSSIDKTEAPFTCAWHNASKWEMGFLRLSPGKGALRL